MIMTRFTIVSKPPRGLRRAGAAALAALLVSAPFSSAALAVETPSDMAAGQEPLPLNLQNRIYTKPSPAPVITPAEVMDNSYYNSQSQTVVGQKVQGLRRDLATLQNRIADLAGTLSSLENSGQTQAAAYYASVATISTQLQSGTTPGNPRLVQKLTVARQNLEQLGASVATFNDLSQQITNASSAAAYMLETVRAAYSLSGAVEEDHVELAKLEDAVNNTTVVIDRLLNNVSDDITRTTAYLDTERNNLRTMSAAVETGSMFGKSLSNRPFASATLASFSGQPALPPPTPMTAPYSATAPQAGNSMGSGSSLLPMAATAAPRAPQAGMRPLVKIRFDRPDVDYEQPVYMAVNEALSRYPDARFELVAVHPGKGNAAQIAIESTKARRYAERVLRSLTNMGLELDRIDLSYTPSAEATSSEVQLYVQ